MKKEVVAKTSRTPVPRTEESALDAYSAMPVVIADDPEYRSFMAPETAPFGTTLQGWYRVSLGLFLRTIGFVLFKIGDTLLRVTVYWYHVALILASGISLLIIYVTR